MSRYVLTPDLAVETRQLRADRSFVVVCKREDNGQWIDLYQPPWIDFEASTPDQACVVTFPPGEADVAVEEWIAAMCLQVVSGRRVR